MAAMRSADEIRKFLREAMEMTSMSAAELARRSGVSKATVFRALNDEYEHVPSSRTLDKLAAVLMDAGIKEGERGEQVRRDLERTQISAHYLIGQGFINKQSGWATPPITPIARDARISASIQMGGRVVDNSCGRFYDPGDYVHLLDKRAFQTAPPAPADHVMVIRTQLAGEMMQCQLYEVLRRSGEELTLRTMGLDPATQRIEILHEASLTRGLDDESYVSHLVVGQYRPRHFLTS